MLAGGIFAIKKLFFDKKTPKEKPQETTESSTGTEVSTIDEEATFKKEVEELIAQADRLALGVNHDEAIELLSSHPKFNDSLELLEAVEKYKTQKRELVKWPDNTQITHIFYHSLIVDTDKAFDGDSDEVGYNQVMTTIEEFNAVMESMYEKGYILISIHDIAEQVEVEGVMKYRQKPIYLPKGKIPFVLSQDDVCYYEYMDGDGFAIRLDIDEDGKPTAVYRQDDGTEVMGAYDMVPLVDDFIDEHPDFSYKGAKGLVGLTGYQGILGYRTSLSRHAESPTLQEDREKAALVAQALLDDGWEFASHTWGHRQMGAIELESVIADTDLWANEVLPLLGGPCDVLLYPFGADIHSWHDYEGPKYEYLLGAGFRFFCTVDSTPYWVQIRQNYVRMGRRNIDGVRMYEALSTEKNRVSDLFDVEKVFDKRRPIPVPML